MNINKSKITLVNILTSLFMQIVSVISALIVPRLILETFGSNANGLVSSILQFLNYITLVEGGITGVISANLYKPLVNHDEKKLSSVLTTARSFYRKIGMFFIGYSIIVGLMYPLFVDTGYEYWYIFILTLILSSGLMLQYMFSLTYTTLLNADKKVYLVSLTVAILTIANIVLTLIIVNLYPDLIALKFSNAMLFALQPLFYGLYIKGHYEIDWSVHKDNTLLNQRWNGFAINLAFFIHTSTDITLLTLLADLKTVSVYSVYYLIVSKISIVLHSLVSGIEPTIGQAYALGDTENLNKKLDLYEFIILFSVGLLFSLTGMLITPFAMIYTSGITDANYYQPVFGIVLVLAESMYLLRSPHVSLAYAANKFKEITLPAYIEAIINIFVSIILMKKYGLIGIATGTLIGMIYRGAFHVYFTSKIISSRRQFVFYKKLFSILVPCLLCSFICLKLYPITEYSIITWVYHAIIYGFILGITLLFICRFCFKNEFETLKNYIKKK